MGRVARADDSVGRADGEPEYAEIFTGPVGALTLNRPNAKLDAPFGAEGVLCHSQFFLASEVRDAGCGR
jgi:hypothetical protein